MNNSKAVDVLEKVKHKLTDQEYKELAASFPPPPYTENVESEPPPLVRRVSKDYTHDTTWNWLANGPKISKVGCPCNNNMANFGGWQHCALCGSNGGYYSDHD